MDESLSNADMNELLNKMSNYIVFIILIEFNKIKFNESSPNYTRAKKF